MSNRLSKKKKKKFLSLIKAFFFLLVERALFAVVGETKQELKLGKGSPDEVL